MQELSIRSRLETRKGGPEGPPFNFESHTCEANGDFAMSITNRKSTAAIRIPRDRHLANAERVRRSAVRSRTSPARCRLQPRRAHRPVRAGRSVPPRHPGRAPRRKMARPATEQGARDDPAHSLARPALRAGLRQASRCEAGRRDLSQHGRRLAVALRGRGQGGAVAWLYSVRADCRQPQRRADHSP